MMLEIDDRLDNTLSINSDSSYSITIGVTKSFFAYDADANEVTFQNTDEDLAKVAQLIEVLSDWHRTAVNSKILKSLSTRS